MHRNLNPMADKAALFQAYAGKSLSEIPTPAFIVNKDIVKENCDAMLTRAENMKASFRAHVKTHKTCEGVGYQLGGGRCTKVVVSTLQEAWCMSEFYKSGEIDDVLYGLPVVKSRLPELVELSKIVKHVRLMIDNEDQLEMLAEFNAKNNIATPWSVFVKVNMGTNRAGVIKGSDELKSLITALAKNEAVSLFGFYCHAGHSYASCCDTEAVDYLYQEIYAANEAAVIAKSIDSKQFSDLAISVGSTPTSHSASIVDMSKIKDLAADLELHAGNYPFCDLQQMSTTIITKDNVACSVLAEVASCYPGRGSDAPGEVLVNAGVIAMAREPGPKPGFGDVSEPAEFAGWSLGRLSQEHGILVPEKGATPKFPPVGQRLRIIPQHSCITANAFLWYYVVEKGSDKVVDIWPTWRGW